MGKDKQPAPKDDRDPDRFDRDGSPLLPPKPKPKPQPQPKDDQSEPVSDDDTETP